MTWNLPKIREACLRLMGWHDAYDNSPNFVSPGGMIRLSWQQVALGDFGKAPDPTESLDDALPLFDRFAMALYLSQHPEHSEKWRCVDDRTNEGDEDDAFAETAPLAVCLCSLRCAGMDLKLFEVNS